MNILKVGAMALILGVSTAAAAQEYPERSIQLIVPFAPGGPTDVVARRVADLVSPVLEQSVVVENRPGAGGVVGADIVAKSNPDGYTIMLCSAGALTINPQLMDSIPYNAETDFAPVVYVATVPYMLLVSADSEFETLADLIAFGEASPGALNYGSAGVGSASHLTSALMGLETGLEMIHVPYGGSSNAMTDLLGGRIQMLFNGLTASLPFIEAGQVRVLGIASDKRSELLPDVPTMDEGGIADFESSTWLGICAPGGTPNAIIEKLNSVIVEAVTTDEARADFAQIGAEVVASTPAEFGDYIANERSQWAKVIEEADIKAQ